MSINSYSARIKNDGGNIQGFYDNSTKKSQYAFIKNSPSRKDVGILTADNLQWAIVSDIDTYEKRRFLFLPDTKIYNGNYLFYQNFTYIVIEHTIDNNFPQQNALLCNYDFPVREEEISTGEIIGKRPSGQPIYKTKPILHTVPSAVTSKFYSSVENAVYSLPEGVLYAYLPYIPNEPTAELDQEIVVHDHQYFVADIIKTKILIIDGMDRGYIEVRLQRMQKNVHAKN